MTLYINFMLHHVLRYIFIWYNYKLLLHNDLPDCMVVIDSRQCLDHWISQLNYVLLR